MSPPAISHSQESPPATVILVGNEKGGTGKSTVAMHIIVGLLRSGFQVGSIDLDSRQASLTRYLANRKATAERDALDLPSPSHVTLAPETLDSREQQEQADAAAFERALAELRAAADFVVIDSPGADSALSRLAMSWADKLVTPLNDSFVDLDLLTHAQGPDVRAGRASIYAEQVWEQRKTRAARDGSTIDWIVMRNRLSSLNSRNKVAMFDVLAELSKRIGFRTARGFAERVIYRELFPLGLTILDIFETGQKARPTTSQIAARQEVRTLILALRLPRRQASQRQVA